MEDAIMIILNGILTIIGDKSPNFYIYGSVATDDFRLGWSDIDFVCLTEKSLDDIQTEKLLVLKNNLCEKYPDDKYLKLFEGVFMSVSAYENGGRDKVVRWGTNGAEILDKYVPNSFELFELAQDGVLVYGEDIRDIFKMPTFSQLKSDVKKHYDTIRKYAVNTSKSIYSFGWLLDISRCLYTLKYANVIAKTPAGEWALDNALCPDIQALGAAVSVRLEPQLFSNPAVAEYSQRLGNAVQEYCDVLERELEKLN